MTLLFTASEMVPYCKTGGLADVVGSLTPVLAGMGHDVHVMLPGYRSIDRAKYGFTANPEKYKVAVGNHTVPFNISYAFHDGVSVYLLENDEYFNRENLYGDADGDYKDNGARFMFYSRAVFEAVKQRGIRPDIIHAHDWQAGLVPAYLTTVFRGDPYFAETGTLFTIHNLGYQGLFPYKVFAETGIPEEEYHWTKLEYYGNVSFIKSGIIYSDAISTVSRAYADEITTAELGFGLEDIFTERRHVLHGIVNGIDTAAWNPETDAVIPRTFSADDPAGKKKCRSELLRMCEMKAGKSVPVIAMITRLDDQKGLDILEDAVVSLMKLDIRLVILGTGSREHHETIEQLSDNHSGKIRAMLKFDNDLARSLYAGADIFLMPSRYEPCGLGQLIAMRYGALPVVRTTGGLIDTVSDLDDDPLNGVGFSFGDYTAEALAGTVTRAVEAFRERGKTRWNQAVNRAMKRDFSWEKSAREYNSLYERIRNHRDG